MIYRDILGQPGPRCVAGSRGGKRPTHHMLEASPLLAVWCATPVECKSALCRLLRENSIDAVAARQARERLSLLSDAWQEVSPTAAVRKLARRLLRTHPLGAADGRQPAAALAIEAPGLTDLHFACADFRLTAAAELEGLVCA